MTHYRTKRGSHAVATMHSALEACGHSFETLPKWLSRLVPTGESCQGNNANVIFIEPREGMPAVVVKLLPQWEGQQEYHPVIYDQHGKQTNQPAAELTDAHDDQTWYVLLEEVVQYDGEQPGLAELYNRLSQLGLRCTDQGSGPPIGWSPARQEYVVSDRDSLETIGSGAHQVEQSVTMTGEELEAEQNQVENLEAEQEQNGWGLSPDQEFEATAEQERCLLQLFGADWRAQLWSMLDVMADPDSKPCDIRLTCALVFADNDLDRCNLQMKAAAAVARKLGKPINTKLARQLAHL